MSSSSTTSHRAAATSGAGMLVLPMEARILDALPQPVIVVDASGTVWYRNAATDQLLGLAPTTPLTLPQRVPVLDAHRARPKAGW